ncbi:DUF4347 domain-containing protein [uncultured Cohaesibacter sp.]|uniref:DUF4347 domain-containing protein n=1 Tax=uncultured Cohaesibacter sp. TaxID=1002546 RepID=UPI002930E364|nr:DUF4347 domain-containing protein [uncultured Cohaesibacter sp.]
MVSFSRLGTSSKKCKEPSSWDEGVTSFVYRELESRIVFDAALGVTVDALGIDGLSPDDSGTDAGADTAEHSDASHAEQDDAGSAADAGENAEASEESAVDQLMDVALADFVEQSDTATSIVFIDSSVDNIEDLIADIDSSCELVIIDSETDGVDLIADILSSRSDIDSIHIISHSEAGTLYLGTAVLDIDSMSGEYADELAAIGDALTDDADILVYGCNFAQGEVGQQAVAQLSALTGADIAASDDLTGASELGGDWDLEVESGSIETDEILDSDTASDWDYLLDSSPSDLTAESGNVQTQYALDTSGDNTALISEELDVDGQGSFTIETTINLETLSSSGWAGNIVEQYSTSENAGFYLYIYDNQLTYIQNNDSSTAIKADVGDLTTGEHSIALVVDGADVSIYIDGTLVANGTESSAMSDSTADLYFFSGLETQVSEIRIWDTALSATDISNYLGADLDGDESNLLALYEFTEGSGETVSDSTVNGYDLTVYDTSASWIAYDYEGLSFNVDATDADADDTISYALTNDASGNFSIDSDTGEVSWSGSDFDISTTQSFDIAVQATDANSNSYVESFSIDIGTDGADSLSADSSNDSVLYGFDGDDTLTSGGGDDLILGGEGDDTVVFTNDYSDYTINYDSETGYIIVTDNTGDDGTDYLTGVDYLQFADQTISVTSAATQFNNRPAITSNSGSKSASISLEENTTSVMTIEASDDDDTLTYSISGGADASLFTIDSETGELSFVTAPDYESPTDSGTDNVYEVTVTVSDGNGGTDSQALAVTVTDDSFEGSITVTTTDDTVDGDTSSISALLSDMGDDGAISLREALIAANNTTGSDTIILSSGTYTLSIEGESEDLCATGDLDVVDDVTILGEGMGSTIIDANGIDRVLEVSSGSLELSDVTLTGGELSNGLGAGLKIKSGASATLTSVDVNGNTITTSGGGAGISNTGTLSMTGGYVRNNSITGGLGGGIQSLNASMTLDSVAVVNNESSVSGGGIYVSSGTATITNSTIGGNTAYYFGGGLYSGSTVTITYSTIANNTASTTGGGGIHNEGTLTLGATIVADNSASNGTNDINGAITSLGYNIIEDTTGTSGTEATDITGTDPGLGTLSDNGGDTLTYAITESSIAYDASGISAPSTDQRGVTRGASADIGAFEVATSNPVITSDDGGDSATLSLAEGETGVTTVTATNEETDETLAYSITGGADADLFTIDSETGALTFVSSPDYENPTDSDGDNVYEVIVQVSDSEGGTDSQTLTITVTNETQAPTVSLPSSFTLAEDNTVTFSSGNSNAITVDAESGSSVTVTLSVENGTLTLSQTTGLTISEGSNGSASLTIVGSVEDVNAALEGLTYVPSLDYVGSASLNISVQDTLWLQATNDASLVARYTFDDSSDLGADSSGNGNDITIYGGASSTDDDQGSVLDLDAGDYGSISGTYGSPESLTLAGWVNLETSGNSGSELISLGNVLLRLDTIKGGVVASFYDGTEWHHVESDTTIEGTGWHYIAFTFDADSNTQTLYIDGVAVASLSETVSISYSGVTSSFIGIHGTKTTVNLDGQVDDIRVYSSALSADEIAALALQTPSDSNSLTITIYEVNDDPTGSVTISGTATEDQTLSADTSTIADADGLGAFSYQWYRDGVAISGATNSTYTLTNDDVGAAITVGVSYTDANGTAESLTSDATAAVTNVNDDPTGSVTISGTATEDQTLSADTSTIADADGLGAFSYQWYRDGVAISGATGSTYTLTNDDVGAAITVGVSYTDANGTAESLTSDATAVVTNVNDDPTGSVTISGTATEDQTLSADTSTIADADGLGAFSYQWYRDGVAISGATNSTYTLSNDDVGAAITVGVSYTDANGTAESLTSDATAAVTNVNDDPTGSVTISGTATEDQTLSADTSTIADADGLGAFSYQWYRDGVAISAATGSTYTLTNDDVGAAITVGVSYTDANGTAESLTSDATAAVTNVNDDPTGSVTISGTATEDQTLSADTSTIADADGLGAFSYQWYRDGVAISGATGSTYTLTNDDVGAAITVGVSYTDANGTAESLTSGATAAVTNVNDDPTGSVTISGTATEDQTLSADTSTIADADGLGAFSYQWYRDGVAISGATNSTYTLTNDDVGAAITVGVSYTDANGTAESLTSDATAAVTNVNDDPTGSVTISGTATEDQTLSADTSTIADADGLGAFSYQWYRDGVAISGATGSTYTLTNDDVGAAITVGVSYTDANGTAESLTSDATAVVTNVNDDPTGSVTISGTATEEEVLTADTSTIADADGLGAFSYQWYRDGVAISGATNSTYTLTNDDVGAAITVGVSYTDANGTAESLTSDATAAVTNVNDDPTGSVTISGTATEDQTLSADTSTIADADGLGAFSYQWYRDGVAISGATGSTYTLTNDDVGAAITVGVSYTDANGTAESLTSDATAVVTNVNDDPTGSVTISGTATEDQRF